MKNNKKIICSSCGKEIKGRYQTRNNYPFGKKSKPVKTRLCSKCKK